mmetsp:Transcript_32945/g.50396  ORF Transcript_32945/g.50396 Transcript_32945/m.50396 type:complete len:249 (+) Transcript_32945:59-805(+)
MRRQFADTIIDTATAMPRLDSSPTASWPPKRRRIEESFAALSIHQPQMAANGSFLSPHHPSTAATNLFMVATNAPPTPAAANTVPPSVPVRNWQPQDAMNDDTLSTTSTSSGGDNGNLTAEVRTQREIVRKLVFGQGAAAAAAAAPGVPSNQNIMTPKPQDVVDVRLEQLIRNTRMQKTAVNNNSMTLPIARDDFHLSVPPLQQSQAQQGAANRSSLFTPPPFRRSKSLPRDDLMAISSNMDLDDMEM